MKRQLNDTGDLRVVDLLSRGLRRADQPLSDFFMGGRSLFPMRPMAGIESWGRSS
jgi:hypothetical protein